MESSWAKRAQTVYVEPVVIWLGVCKICREEVGVSIRDSERRVDACEHVGPMIAEAFDAVFVVDEHGT
jgi:hypothetical protein